MTEAWWASRVSPPTVGEMFGWLFPWQMLRIIFGILGGLAKVSVLYLVVDWFFLPVFVVPVTIGVFALYVVFRLLRAIPIKAIQDFVVLRGVEFFLSDWFGDIRLLLADRTQAANIRTAIGSALRWLEKNNCTTLVVIGHSGGTIAGYMTLTDYDYTDIEVARFITHGQALGLAWRLGRAREPSRVDRKIDRLYWGDRLRIPLNTARRDMQWFDFWATHDPAPAGGFGATWELDVATPKETHGGSTMVYNRMSLRNDHGSYWDNDESFVLPVARLIDTAPGKVDPSTSRFFPHEPQPSRAKRREHRVVFLQYAWVGPMVSASLAIALGALDLFANTHLTKLDEIGVGLYEFIVWLFSPFIAFAAYFGVPPPPASNTLHSGFLVLLGSAAFLVVSWAVSRVMGALWNAWDRREREIALQPKPQWRPVGFLILQLAFCSLASLVLLLFALNGTWQSLVPTATLLFAAVVVMIATPRGLVRRPGSLETTNRTDIVDRGEPGVAEA